MKKLKYEKVTKTIEPEKENQSNIQVTKVIPEDEKESNKEPTDNQLKVDTIII